MFALWRVVAFVFHAYHALSLSLYVSASVSVCVSLSYAHTHTHSLSLPPSLSLHGALLRGAITQTRRLCFPIYKKYLFRRLEE